MHELPQCVDHRGPDLRPKPRLTPPCKAEEDRPEIASECGGSVGLNNMFGQLYDTGEAGSGSIYVQE